MTRSRVSSGMLCVTLLVAFAPDRVDENVSVKIAHPHPSGGRLSEYRPES